MSQLKSIICQLYIYRHNYVNKKRIKDKEIAKDINDAKVNAVFDFQFCNVRAI